MLVIAAPQEGFIELEKVPKGVIKMIRDLEQLPYKERLQCWEKRELGGDMMHGMQRGLFFYLSHNSRT